MGEKECGDLGRSPRGNYQIIIDHYYIYVINIPDSNILK